MNDTLCWHPHSEKKTVTLETVEYLVSTFNSVKISVKKLGSAFILNIAPLKKSDISGKP